MKNVMAVGWVILFWLGGFVVATAAGPADEAFDVVVVEATPGGIATAVRAAREGLRVALVNRTEHLGGILSSGLGVWDTVHEGKRSPIYDEVRGAIQAHYRSTYGEESPQYRASLPGKSGHTNGRFEPRIAEKILTELVAREKKITLLKGYVPMQVEREGRRMLSVTLEKVGTGRTVRLSAGAFVDATYEGDLLALAQVGFRVGREARSEFDEPHAGKIYLRSSKTPPSPEVARLAELHDRLDLRKFTGYQEIVLPESTGAGDGNVQAFNYRTVLSSDPANRLPVEKPADYDPVALSKLEFGSIVSPLPNDKVGWNRPQLIGPHQAYVEGDWVTRLKVMDAHWQATMGLLYYLQNDPAVPESRREFFGAYGLAKDEFVDHGHRPYELYVREARRLKGRYTMTEHDFGLASGTERTPIHADSVAFADWYMDAHACTLSQAQGSLDEGKMMLHHQSFPAQVPYRALQSPDLDNLLVPVCLSATHVAWGAIRLEPTWMQIGEAVGYACAQAKRDQVTPAEISTARLVQTLVGQQSMVSFFNKVDIAQGDPATAAAQVFATRGFFSDYDARLEEPLKEATAKVWLEAATQPSADDAVAQKVAQAVAQAEAGDSAALGREGWEALLQAKKLKSAPGTRAEKLTRGAALVELFEMSKR